MEKKHFGFGIVGAGMIAHFHAKAIAEIANARLIGVYSVNKPKADAFADQHHCTAYETLEHLLAVPEIDIVCICTPSGIHLEPALKSIEAGKHCVIEKPLEITVERCDRIIAAARDAGVKVGVIFPSRFYEASRQLKASLDGNRFGNLVLGSAYVKWHRSEAYYASGRWRGTWEYDGGGALMNQGIHSVDLLQWYMGPVASVQAVAANRQHRNIEVEDTIVATLHFRNGALGTLECSTAVYPGTLKRIEIMGSEGTAILEEDHFIAWQFQQESGLDVQIRNSMKKVTAAAGGASNPADISFVGHQRQLEDLIHSIETGAEPLIDGEEGRKSVEIVRAIYESARSGNRVKLSTPK